MGNTFLLFLFPVALAVLYFGGLLGGADLSSFISSIVWFWYYLVSLTIFFTYLIINLEDRVTAKTIFFQILYCIFLQPVLIYFISPLGLLFGGAIVVGLYLLVLFLPFIDWNSSEKYYDIPMFKNDYSYFNQHELNSNQYYSVIKKYLNK